MSDNKKYYYLKLKDNFFETDSMLVLESMPDGHLYSNILLKLYLRSLKSEGKLMFNDRIPYNSNILSTVTRQPVGVIEKALSIFRELELIDILDNGAIYMLDIQNYIGKSTTEADRKRIYRTEIQKQKEKQNLLTGQNSDKCPDKSPPEIEIEIEIEKEIELDIEIDIDKEKHKNPPHTLNQKRKYGEYKKVQLTDEQFETLKEQYPNYKDLIIFLDEYIEMSGKKYKNHYLAIKKWVVDAVNQKNQKKSSNNIFDEIGKEEGYWT